MQGWRAGFSIGTGASAHSPCWNVPFNLANKINTNINKIITILVGFHFTSIPTTLLECFGHFMGLKLNYFIVLRSWTALLFLLSLVVDCWIVSFLVTLNRECGGCLLWTQPWLVLCKGLPGCVVSPLLSAVGTSHHCSAAIRHLKAMRSRERSQAQAWRMAEDSKRMLAAKGRGR